MEEIPFYDDRYKTDDPDEEDAYDEELIDDCLLVKENGGGPMEETEETENKEDRPCVDTSNPLAIYRFLLERVYKQDRYCRDASMILYDHLRGITSRNIVCGPAGCGKTYVWECLKEIYPRIITVDVANLTKEGWSGGSKVNDFLEKVEVDVKDYIVVFDEFDKCATPMYSRHDENVSASIQSEFLKLVEGKVIKSKRAFGNVTVDTSGMTFVFCGSFAQKAEEIAETATSSGFGFEKERKEGVAFEKELTPSDLVDFGVITELVSRCTRLINVRPLTLEDYTYLLAEHGGSPLKMLEKKYGMEFEIPDEKTKEIARNAFESGLGIRNVSAQIQRMMDDEIFARFVKKEEHSEPL